MMRIRAVGSTSSQMVRRFRLKMAISRRTRPSNGKKYEFDQYGAMTAEWSLDVRGSFYEWYKRRLQHISYQQVYLLSMLSEWRYFNSVEDGSRVSKGWFKVVAAEYLNYEKYNDDEDAWYYADGKRQPVCRRVQDHQGQEVCVP